MNKEKTREYLKKFFIMIYIQIILFFALKSLIINFTNVRADYYTEAAKFYKAISLYNRTLFLDKKNLHALVYCGYSYEDINNLNLAQAYYRKAIKYHPNQDTGYYFLGLLNMRLKNYIRAKELFERVFSLGQEQADKAQEILLLYEKKLKKQT